MCLSSRPGRDAIPRFFRPPFRYALGLFFLLGLVQVFNPLSPSIFYGLLGLKLYFYYIPLMFVGYAMLRQEDDLRRLLTVSMGLAGVIALIGIIQSIVGVDFLNPHSGADIEELSHVVRFTSTGIHVARPTSVFVSDGRFGQYLILAFILGLGAAGYQLLRKSRGGIITFPAVALLAVAAMVSGSRGAFAWTAISALVLSAGMLWGAPTRIRGRLPLGQGDPSRFCLCGPGPGLGGDAFPGRHRRALGTLSGDLIPGTALSSRLASALGIIPRTNFSRLSRTLTGWWGMGLELRHWARNT